MVDIYQVRVHLADWLLGKSSLSEFEDWFVPATWNVKGSEELFNFVNEIELNLSEYSGGYLSELDMRYAMRRALQSVSQTKVMAHDSNVNWISVQVQSMLSQGWGLQRIPAA